MAIRIIEKSQSAYAYPLLIKNLLTPPLRYAPDQEIVYRDQYRYTYRNLPKRVAKLAHALGDMGVTAGDTVAMMDWDSPRYLECYFAVPMIGAVLHTLDIRLSPKRLAYTINHAEDDVIIVHADFLPLLRQIRNQIETDKKIVVIREDAPVLAAPFTIVGEYEDLLFGQPCEYIFPDFDENAAATIFYTAGTTGLPKGVSFSHRQIVLHAYGVMSGLCAFRSFAAVDSGDVYMPLAPLFDVHAWGMPYLFTMLGAKQVYPGKYDPGKILQIIADEKITFSHCDPTTMRLLLNDPAIRRVDLTGWKVVVGASAIPKALCEEALAHGINLFNAYGMSETGPLVAIASCKPYMKDWTTDRQMEIRCRTGMPVPNVDVEIIDPQGKPLPRGGRHTGEVVVRSPWLVQAYYKEYEKSESLWHDGWLHTGDEGYVDDEGYLHILDRVKDVFNAGGDR
jgi:fatty-acyl-CoA synthase